VTHPFFDALRFPWDRPDAKAFFAVLPDLVGTPAEITRVYRSSVPDLDPLTPAAAHHMWQEALDRLTPAGGLGPLCDQLLARQLNGRIRALIEAVKLARPSVDSLEGGHDGGVVILDRVVLRGHIRQLSPADTPLKAIVVRGDPASGKSHGRYLFELAARDQPADVVYLSADMVATVGEVIEELFSTLNASGEIPPPGETTDVAHYRKVWQKLREIADRRQRQLWLAVDDLGPSDDGAPLLDEEVRVFLEQLVPRLENPAYRRWFRLMLIHYPDRSLPTRWKREVVAEDRTAEADVGAEHVAEVLRAWAERSGKTVIQSDIEATAAEIVTEAGKAAGTRRLRRLNDLVTDTLRTLAGDHA
jgi:hypothetical protein